MNIKKPGYIYIVFNNAYLYYNKTTYKIGKTTSVKNRMSNYSTYYVEPIKIKYVSDICIDHNLAEKEIFIKLRQYRITEKREFFNINLEYAIEIIKTTINDINKKS